MNLKFSTTDIERVQAFALRHMCLAEEMGDHEFTIAPHKLFIDMLDTPDSSLVTVWDGPEIIGTVRMLFRKHSLFIEDEFYHWDWLAANFGITVAEMHQKSFLFDRACVRAEYRRLGLYDQMLAFTCAYARQNNIEFIVSCFEDKNLKAKYWAEKNKFSFYPRTLKSGLHQWYLICRKV